MPGFHEVFLWSRLMAIAANVQQAGPFLYSNDTYNNDRHSPGFRILCDFSCQSCWHPGNLVSALSSANRTVLIGVRVILVRRFVGLSTSKPENHRREL